jgi:repressor LexA
MARTPPGETRERVYRYVRERLMRGRPPTLREVQRALGFRAVESARGHLEALAEEGRLVKRPGEARGYLLPGDQRPAALVPLLGRVQAGALSTAVEDVQGYLPVQQQKPGEELFALRVRGESMTGAAILPGDVVIVRRQATAAPGDVVVALVGDEATVKRLRIRSGRAELHAENPDFPPIVPPPSELRILGKVVEVRRRLDGPAGAGRKTTRT